MKKIEIYKRKKIFLILLAIVNSVLLFFSLKDNNFEWTLSSISPIFNFVWVIYFFKDISSYYIKINSTVLRYNLPYHKSKEINLSQVTSIINDWSGLQFKLTENRTTKLSFDGISKSVQKEIIAELEKRNLAIQ